jgi:hypothetical protein
VSVTWISIEFCNGIWTKVSSLSLCIIEVPFMIKTKTYKAKDEVVKPQEGQNVFNLFLKKKADSSY